MSVSLVPPRRRTPKRRDAHGRCAMTAPESAAAPRIVIAPNAWHPVDLNRLRPNHPEAQEQPVRARSGVCGSADPGPRLHELLCQYRLKPGADGQPVHLGGPVRRSDEAAPILAKVLAGEPVEVFGVLCLTTTCHVICWHQVSRGWLDGTYVEPREIFQTALLTNAASVILAHNHPSGDPTPSPLDLEVTKRLIRTGRLFGIPVVDHIIIGDGAFTSVRRASWPARHAEAADGYAGELRGAAGSCAADSIFCRRGTFTLPS